MLATVALGSKVPILVSQFILFLKSKPFFLKKKKVLATVALGSKDLGIVRQGYVVGEQVLVCAPYMYALYVCLVCVRWVLRTLGLCAMGMWLA